MESESVPAVEKASSRPPAGPTARIEPARPEVYNFRFAAGKSFREKLLRAAEVLGIENPERNMAEILEKGLDLFLEKKDPLRQWARRLEREERKQTGSARESRPGEISNPRGVPAVPRPARSRHVPARVRERVLEKADYRCEFRGPDGTRCTSRTGLEIEHTKPFAIHRDHEERFLEALCPGHNRYRAERVYGKDFIRRKIDERSARGAPQFTVARVPHRMG
jgi:hypothetical protein